MAIGLREFAHTTTDSAGHPIFNTEQGEELMHIQPNVAIVLGNFPPLSPGTLYITSKQVVWLSDVDRTKGYAIDFLSLSLHAVSRDPEAYPSPCIYTQIETEADEDEDESVDSDAETNEPLEISRITEMRLIPSDPSQLDTLFEMFCECAELNPEPAEVEEEEHNWIFSADQMEDDGTDGDDNEWQIYQNPTSLIGQSNGFNDLAHSVLELHINDERFEDAEEAERRSNSKNQ